jgi:hypothetical protein
MSFDYPCNANTLTSSLSFTQNELLDVMGGNGNIIDSSTAGSIQNSTNSTELGELANTRASSMKPSPTNINQEASVFIQTYVNGINTLNDKIKIEYCYYYQRYYVAVRDFLNYLIDYNSATFSAAANSDYQNKLNRALNLNKRLTFLTEFTNSLATNYNNDGVNYNSQINTLNTQMTQNKSQLDVQRRQFQDSNVNLETNRRMVEFTQEKNRANNNLLAMYAVLNVAAFAMLVYVART